MSKRIAITAIALLAFGGVMIPGGPIINNVIRDLTYGSVDEGLLGIKEQGIPIVIESVDELGLKSLAISLAIVKEMGAEASELLANATIFMGQIKTVEANSIYAIYDVGGYDALLNPMQSAYFDVVEYYYPAWFEGSTFSQLAPAKGYPPILGISEWYGYDLNFTQSLTLDTPDFTGLDHLKYGRNTTGMEMWWGDRLPGIYEDTYRRVGDDEWPPENYPRNFSISVETVDMNQDRGFGVIEIMDIIERANETEMLQLCGPYGYNFTNPYDMFPYKGVNYTKLEIFYFYLIDYYFPIGINLIVPQFNFLANQVSKDYPQYTKSDWNDYDVSYEDITTFSIIEQWAKGISYDEGADLHDSEPLIPEGTYGLEPGGPGKSSGIPMQAALQLFNVSNNLSLTNIEGIYKWKAAYDNDTDAYNELFDEFSQYPGYNVSVKIGGQYYGWKENDTYDDNDWGFGVEELNLTLDWLFGNGGEWGNGSFYENIFPTLINEKSAFRILVHQWAYGTIGGSLLYPEGFAIRLGFAEIHGFEIGYQGPGKPVISTEMPIRTALKLWDESNEYSLVTKIGLGKWFAAVGGDVGAYEELQSALGLSNGDMDLLLDWIPNFQQNVMPYLAQYQYGLPADSITLGNLLQVGGIGLGATCVGLGSIALIGNVVVRKRKRLNPFEVGH